MRIERKLGRIVPLFAASIVSIFAVSTPSRAQESDLVEIKPVLPVPVLIFRPYPERPKKYVAAPIRPSAAKGAPAKPVAVQKQKAKPKKPR